MIFFRPIISTFSNMITGVGGLNAVEETQAVAEQVVNTGFKAAVGTALVAGSAIHAATVPARLFANRSLAPYDRMLYSLDGIYSGNSGINTHTIMLDAVTGSLRKALLDRDTPVRVLERIRQKHPYLSKKSLNEVRRQANENGGYGGWHFFHPTDYPDNFVNPNVRVNQADPLLVRALLDYIAAELGRESVAKLFCPQRGIVGPDNYVHRLLVYNLGTGDTYCHSHQKEDGGLAVAVHVLGRAENGRMRIEIPQTPILHKLYDDLPERYQKTLLALIAVNGTYVVNEALESHFLEKRITNNLEVMWCSMRGKWIGTKNPDESYLTTLSDSDQYWTENLEVADTRPAKTKRLDYAKSCLRAINVRINSEGIFFEANCHTPNAKGSKHLRYQTPKLVKRDYAAEIQLYVVAGVIIGYKWVTANVPEEVQKAFLDIYTCSKMQNWRNTLTQQLPEQGIEILLQTIKERLQQSNA